MYKLITAITLLATLSGSAQTALDKRKIYQSVIEKFSNKNLPIVNETFGKIEKYDIDGDVNKWFYQRGSQPLPDSSEIVVSAICVVPIQYAQPVVGFLQTKNITSNPSDFLNQIDEVKLDSLSNYLLNDRFISWKKGPIFKSFWGNLFKKSKVTVLSSILVDHQNNIALVKLQEFAKNKSHSENPSRIIVLKKVGIEWMAVGVLDKKQPPRAYTSN